MDRKEIKKNAKGSLKRNYLITILVVFIVGIILGGGYTFTTAGKNVTTKSNTVQKTNYELINDTVKNISKQTKDGKAKGIIAPVFNNITKNNSIVFAGLNSLNLYLLKNSVNSVIISIVGVIILLFIKIFIKDVFTIGYKRYFLEQRRYKTSIKKILFPFTVRKNFHIAYIVFMKNLYEFLWSLTVIGGIIKHYQYLMLPYVIAENPNINKKEAFRLSKEMTKGNKWNIFKTDISLIGWELLNILSFGLLQLFFLDGYKQCIYAEIYMNIRDNRKNNLTDEKLLNDKYLDIKEYKDEEYPMDKFTIPVIIKKKDKKRDYNVKYSIKNYILMFFTFAFTGWAWEVLLHIVKDGKFVNRGTMLGPWLPIYGFGGVLILIILKPFRKKPILLFILAILLCGVLEYTGAWYLETFKHAKWWDYSGYFFNIHGRVCLEGLLVFGLGGAAATYFVGPVLNELYSKIKPRISLIICFILLILFGSDMIYSSKHPNTGKGITDYGEAA